MEISIGSVSEYVSHKDKSRCEENSLILIHYKYIYVHICIGTFMRLLLLKSKENCHEKRIDEEQSLTCICPVIILSCTYLACMNDRTCT